MFESLESRVLMSVTVDDGVLKITGTRNNDTYTITQSGTTLTINSSVDGRRRFRGIDKIVIRGRDGNDLVRASRSRTRMEIYGGSGADERLP